MPLQFVTRFSCDDCGLELSIVGTCDVKAFPFILAQAGVKKPPPGWTVDGTTCKCPDHASQVKLYSAKIASVLNAKGN